MKAKHASRLGYAAAAGLPLLVVLAWVLPHPGAFNQWDNHELFTPVVWQSQTQLLAGDFPHWTHSQHMGQPIHAFGQYGVLYPLYTVSVVIAKVTGLGPARLADIITAVHAALAGFMLFGLLRRFRAPQPIALGAAVSAACGGYYLFQNSGLFFALPYLAWTAAAMWATVAIIDARGNLGHPCAVLIVSLALIANLGHAQFTLYSAVTVAAFAACYLTHRRRWRQRAGPLAVCAWAGILLAMPTVLPNWSILADTGRSGAVPREAFGAHAITVAALRGLILPTFQGADGYSAETTLFTIAGGAWCIPAILCGVLCGRPRNGMDRHLLLLCLFSACIAAVFLMFAMGDNTPLYGLTYDLPVWSRFRWPYKWIGYVLPLLTVAAVLGVMRIALRGCAPRRCIVAVGMYLVAVMALYVVDGVHTPWALAATLAGLASVAALMWIGKRRVQHAFVVLLLIEAFCVLALSQHPHRFKAYRDQAYNPHWAQRFDIDTAYRVMPGSPSNPPGAYLNELGLFEVATLDGYRSLTGGRWALTSSLLATYLPCHGEGHFPRHMLVPLLQSHLLRSYNTRYVIAHIDDAPLVEFLENEADWLLHAADGVTRIYANRDALPRAYFASQVYPGGDEAMRGIDRQPGALRSAFVDGETDAAGMPTAAVRSMTWRPNDAIIKVDAPDGGVLVVSMCYNPRWHATVDGDDIPIQRTNGAIMSLRVPPGGQTIKLRYVDPAFRRGMICAAAGAAFLLWFTLAGFVRVSRGS